MKRMRVTKQHRKGHNHQARVYEQIRPSRFAASERHQIACSHALIALDLEDVLDVIINYQDKLALLDGARLRPRAGLDFFWWYVLESEDWDAYNLVAGSSYKVADYLTAWYGDDYD